DLAGALPGAWRHRLRLPALAVVAVDLQMADRRTETGAPGVAHGEQGDLVVELDQTLDDHPAAAGAAAFLRVAPGGGNVRLAAHQALPLAGGAHHRLGNARQTDLPH